jgi:membrane-associated phospholipid phosphatase
MNTLLEWDQAAFLAVNRGLSHPWLDTLLIPIRNMYFWAPLYLFFITWLLINFGKKGGWVILLVLVTFALTDLSSSHLIKPLVGRLRPCNEPMFAEYVRLLVHCGGGKSFTSSHAANHFGMALFLGLVFKPYFKPALTFFVIWAGTISFAQVYVGVHYPLDVFSGALLGTGLGAAMWFIYNNHFHLIK